MRRPSAWEVGRPDDSPIDAPMPDLIERFKAGDPDAVRAISIGLDRTTVPMEETLPPGTTKPPRETMAPLWLQKS